VTNDPTAAGGNAGGNAGGRHRPGSVPWRRTGRCRLLAAATVAAALVLGGMVLPGCGSGQPAANGPNPGVTRADGTRAATPGAPASLTPAATPGTTAGARPVTAAGVTPDPVRLRVPDIAVAAPVVPLRLDAAGTLIPPSGFTEVGWNEAVPEPGDDGVAVIAGHVDSRTGPAVFYRLRGLNVGATVLVDRADRTTATFVVDRLAEYAKADFPDEEVYHSGSGAQLRLITCGGTFNHGTGHYVDNVVAFAHLG